MEPDSKNIAREHVLNYLQGVEPCDVLRMLIARGKMMLVLRLGIELDNNCNIHFINMREIMLHVEFD